MDKNELWQKFCQDGRVEDYIAYKNAENVLMQTELEKDGKNNGAGAGNKGAEYW